MARRNVFAEVRRAKEEAFRRAQAGFDNVFVYERALRGAIVGAPAMSEDFE